MKEVSADNFGLVIAYLLPGFVALCGVSYFSAPVRSWMGNSPLLGPTVGGFLYVTLASIGAGLLVSTVRWLAIDRLHHWTGIKEPRWDFEVLQDRLAVFEVLVQFHYRYYQFYANTLVAGAFWYMARFISVPPLPGSAGITDVAVVIGLIVLYAGSRDTLRKYYNRVTVLLKRGTTLPSE
jgi:hypothetical protein